MTRQAHMKEEAHTDRGGEMWLTLKPMMVGERLIRTTEVDVWKRQDELTDTDEPVLALQSAEIPAKYDDNNMLVREMIPAVMIPRSRMTVAYVRDGETQSVRLLPSPTLEPDAQPVTISYDEALLAWRHHRWPDCTMTDRP
jgi:hypothetical protein